MASQDREWAGAADPLPLRARARAIANRLGLDGKARNPWRPFRKRTEIMMIQTADADIYADLLAAGSEINRLYCRMHDVAYRSFIGIKRGYFSWHTSFNRIVMLEELVRQGYGGWVFYLDADAFVFDLDYRVRKLIRRHDAAMIAAPGGGSGEHWDINTGIFLINLGTSDGRAIVRLWYDDFMRVSESELRRAPAWDDVLDDQSRLQDIFKRNPVFAASALVHVPRLLLNDSGARFVRQILRDSGWTVEQRAAWIREQAGAQLKRRKNTG